MNGWHMVATQWVAQLPEGPLAPGSPVSRPASQIDVLLWGGILIGVILVGSVVIMLLRRRINDPSATTSQDVGFSLSDLRDMRDRGEITPEEYEATRAKVIAKVKGQSAESSPAPPPPPPSFSPPPLPPELGPDENTPGTDA